MERKILIVEDDLGDANNIVKFLSGMDLSSKMDVNKDTYSIKIDKSHLSAGEHLIGKILELAEPQKLDFEFGEIIIARTKDSAMKVYNENKNDIAVIFLDLWIPEKDIKESSKPHGLSLLQEFLNIEAERRPWIIVTSKLLNSETQDKILKIAQQKNAVNDLSFLHKDLFKNPNSLNTQLQPLTNIFYLNLYTKPPYPYLGKLKSIFGDFEGLRELAYFMYGEKEIADKFDEKVRKHFSKNIKSAQPELYTEYDKIDLVIMHKPGAEIKAVTPENKEKCLFDNPVNFDKFSEEHENLVKIIENNGGEVVYVTDLLKTILEDKKYGVYLKARLLWLIKGRIGFDITDYWKLLKHFADSDIETYINFLMSGYLEKEKKFYFEPVPNFVFTRDWAFCVHDTLFLSKMAKPIRQREVDLAEFILKFSGKIPESNIKKIETEGTLEGGDVLLPKSDVVFIGMSERTSFDAVKTVKDELLSKGTIKEVIVIEAPFAHIRGMHLDTYLGFIDGTHALVYKGVLDREFFCIKYEKHKGETIEIKTLRNILKEKGFEIIEVTDEREQYDDACNIFALEPGKIVIYDRVKNTCNSLMRNGIRIETCKGDELIIARGGPHCLTLPVKRKKIEEIKNVLM